MFFKGCLPAAFTSGEQLVHHVCVPLDDLYLPGAQSSQVDADATYSPGGQESLVHHAAST